MGKFEMMLYRFDGEGKACKIGKKLKHLLLVAWLLGCFFPPHSFSFFLFSFCFVIYVAATFLVAVLAVLMASGWMPWLNEIGKQFDQGNNW